MHDLRVTVRRLRLLALVGRPLLRRGTEEALRRWGRQMAQKTSRLRDLDVAVEWLGSRPDAREAVARIREQRERLWRKIRMRLRPPPEGMVRALAAESDGRGAAERLERRLHKLENRNATWVRKHEAGFFVLSGKGQHDFRRILRRWRYVRELALPSRGMGEDGFLKRLVEAQEATGDLQNLRLAAGACRSIRGLGRAPSIARGLARDEAKLLARIQRSLGALNAPGDRGLQPLVANQAPTCCRR